jgi:hypothetical protein
MKDSPKRRKGESQLKEWTARLNRFAEARTPEERQAVLENALQINPGGTIRSMLEAWGYSASGRGRKAKDAKEVGKPARERLEDALTDIFGAEHNPVRSLYPKLAGKMAASVRDAGRIVAALFVAWPEPLKITDAARSAEDRRRRARQSAEEFIRALLAELSSGRSQEWTAIEMDLHGFRLSDEERIGASQFIKEAGENEGALIVASARSILVGPDPIQEIRDFQTVTRNFVDEGSKGLLIFVVNAGIFDAGEDGYNLLYNLSHLSTAVTAFALFDEGLNSAQTIKLYKVDWSRWQTLARRCCIVMRRPPLISPDTGELLARDDFDDFIGGWQPPRPFDRLKDLGARVSFDSAHVLPPTYPATLDAHETLSGTDLYWDVTVRPRAGEPDGLKVEFFIPPAQPVAPVTQSHTDDMADEANHAPQDRSGRGRRPTRHRAIEGEGFYIIRKPSPGKPFDDAQRAIYLAARARLRLDSGQKHARNLLAAEALRQIGFEVLPLATAISLLPRSLYYAAAAPHKPGKRNGN